MDISVLFVTLSLIYAYKFWVRLPLKNEYWACILLILIIVLKQVDLLFPENFPIFIQIYLLRLCKFYLFYINCKIMTQILYKIYVWLIYICKYISNIIFGGRNKNNVYSLLKLKGYYNGILNYAGYLASVNKQTLIILFVKCFCFGTRTQRCFT